MYATLQIYNWSLNLKLEIWYDLPLSNCRTFYPYPSCCNKTCIKGIAILVVEFDIRGCKIQQTFAWKWRILWYILKWIDELCSKKAGAHCLMFFTSNALVIIEEIKIQGGSFGAKQYWKSSPFTMKLGQIASIGSAFSC